MVQDVTGNLLVFLVFLWWIFLEKGKSLLASGKKLLIVLRLFGSKRKSFHIFTLCNIDKGELKLDILIASSHRNGTGLWHRDEERFGTPA